MDAAELEELLTPVQFVTTDPDATPDLLADELRRRVRLMDVVGDDESLQRVMRAMCKADPCFLFDQFLFTFDPRETAYYPFVLWPRQRELVQFQHEAIQNRQETLVEKSRDTGASYVFCGMALNYWLFTPGFKTTFCANKLDNVDTLGDPDSLFEKLRIMLERLPPWLMPKGFSWTADSMQARLINPVNKNIIGGEGGKEAGRGGRSSWYVIDEAAFVDEAERVNRATSANTNARTWASTPDPDGHFFARHRRNPRVAVFTFAWQDHPARDEAWAEAKKELIGEREFKIEYEIAYDGLAGGMVIERPWAEACVELCRRHAHELDLSVFPVRAAMDVGAGKSESTLAVRRGPLVEPIHAMRSPDTTEAAEWAFQICREAGAPILVFDSVGVGTGVASTLRRLEDEDGDFRPLGFVGGQTPAEDGSWEEGRHSKDKFVNLRAEVWWRMREACRRSYERYLDEEGREGGVPHPIEECLLLPDDEILIRQMCSVPYRTVMGRRIQLEAKKNLKTQNIASPDRPDAVAMTLWDPLLLDLGSAVIAGAGLGRADARRDSTADELWQGGSASEAFMRSRLGRDTGRWW